MGRGGRLLNAGPRRAVYVNDPSLFWMAAIGGLGAFTGWLLRDYIAFLKAQIDSWRTLAYKGANVAEKAIEKVSN